MRRARQAPLRADAIPCTQRTRPGCAPTGYPGTASQRREEIVNSGVKLRARESCPVPIAMRQ